eukprot:scaffold310634_cov12-Prasinocladus_malaysianus.AAC.1
MSRCLRQLARGELIAKLVYETDYDKSMRICFTGRYRTRQGDLERNQCETSDFYELFPYPTRTTSRYRINSLPLGGLESATRTILR